MYIKNYKRGLVFLCAFIFLYILCKATLMSSKYSVYTSVIIGQLYAVIIPVIACVDSFKITRRMRTKQLYNSKHYSRNPWFATFLSLILPGLGHAYLQKWSLLAFYLILFSISWILSLIWSFWLYPLPFSIRVIACIHSYLSTSMDKEKQYKPISYFAIFLTTFYVLSTLLSIIVSIYFVHHFICGNSTSMVPKVYPGDFVVLNKLKYKWTEPKIGDIISFDMPQGVRNNAETHSVFKRVIAQAGDFVRKDAFFQEDVNSIQVKRSIEKYLYFKEHHAVSLKEFIDKYIEYSPPENNLQVESTEYYLVPENHYFVLGENLEESCDSRYYGAVPKRFIIGKVTKIVWPPKRIGTLYEE